MSDSFLNLIDKSRVKIDDFLQKNKKFIVVIRWTTATWKTKLSIELSKYFGMEIISSDSRQIFRYMDIWTDKISKDIQKRVKHYQIDIVNPDEKYTAWQWKKDSELYIDNILYSWKIPFIVWWTWLYIDTLYKNYSMPWCKPDYDLRNKLYEKENKNPWILHKLLQEIDPITADKLHKNSIRYIVRALEIFYKTWMKKSNSEELPVKYPILMIWIWREKNIVNKLIKDRIYEMIDRGLIEETEKLLNMWYTKDLQSMQWIWYKQVVKYLNWEYSKEDMILDIQKNTEHLAKKQRTRFRRYINDWKNNPKKNVEYLVVNI